MTRHLVFGCALGALLGAAAGAAFPATRPETPQPRGRLVPDCDGALAHLAVHYVSGAGAALGRAHREFLSALPDDVTVHVLVPDVPAFDEFASAVGPTAAVLESVVAHHPLTPWSRDRWLALRTTEDGAALISPAKEHGSDVWPARRGDGRSADHIAAVLDNTSTSWRAPLLFDGGDFVADERMAFVSPTVRDRNPGLDDEALRERLEALTGLRTSVLPRAPRYHIGMYLMLAGDGVALVSDPGLARTLLRGTTDEGLLPVEVDWSAETREDCDAVAEACRRAGYVVRRLPAVQGCDARTFITYTNVIIDERDGGRTTYMPVYRHVPALNDAAEQIWRSAGVDVRRVDCTDVFPHFGSLRCLVNVVSRRPCADSPANPYSSGSDMRPVELDP